MSTAKRSRRRQADGRSVSPQPDAKRFKVLKSVHVPGKSGLDFLVDENARAGKKLEARLTNGVSASKSARVDDSHTTVASNTVQEEDGPKAAKASDIIDVSSDDDSSSIDDEEEEEEEDGVRTGHEAETPKKLTNGHISESGDENHDVSVGAQESKIPKSLDDTDAMEDDSPLDEPTFGDLLQSRHPEPLDIGGSGPAQALVPAPDSRGLAPPSSTSLATALAQALKTNDKDLLESCFRLTDIPSIRSTIQRLPSQHVGTLLQRIAERIQKRPGRTGSLMVWIQWSLVAHGAYFASQPDIMRKVKALTRVIRARANGLQPLLHLKGKLDLLSAQLELRRDLNHSTGQTDDEDDEEAVRYVEGEDEEEWSESDGETELDVNGIRQPVARKENTRSQVNGSASRLTNGVRSQSSNDDDDGADDRDGLLDIEAEESEDEDDEKDSDEEAESEEDLDEEDDVLDDDDDDESEAEVRPPKHNTLKRKR